MLWRVYPSDIVEGTDETAQRDEYLIIRISVDFDSARLKWFMDLLILVPEYVCVSVELIVVFFFVLLFQL